MVATPVYLLLLLIACADGVGPLGPGECYGTGSTDLGKPCGWIRAVMGIPSTGLWMVLNGKTIFPAPIGSVSPHLPFLEGNHTVGLRDGFDGPLLVERTLTIQKGDLRTVVAYQTTDKRNLTVVFNDTRPALPELKYGLTIINLDHTRPNTTFAAYYTSNKTKAWTKTVPYGPPQSVQTPEILDWPGPREFRLSKGQQECGGMIFRIGEDGAAAPEEFHHVFPQEFIIVLAVPGKVAVQDDDDFRTHMLNDLRAPWEFVGRPGECEDAGARNNVDCEKRLSGCEAVALGETTACPDSCNPCGGGTECDAYFETTRWGRNADGPYAGGWARIRETCACGSDPSSAPPILLLLPPPLLGLLAMLTM